MRDHYHSLEKSPGLCAKTYLLGVAIAEELLLRVQQVAPELRGGGERLLHGRVAEL